MVGVFSGLQTTPHFLVYNVAPSSTVSCPILRDSLSIQTSPYRLVKRSRDTQTSNCRLATLLGINEKVLDLGRAQPRPPSL